MSAKTGIEWTDATWNPVVGCSKVSQGCKHCYAKTLHDTRHQAFLAGKPAAPQYREPFETVQIKPERLRYPFSWREPRRIFVNSVSDLFHEGVPDAFIDQVFAVMALALRHTFQVLTKRPGRMRDYFAHPNRGAQIEAAATEIAGDDAPALAHADGWRPLPNVWLGTSVENQAAADERIPFLLATPAAVRLLSCEPLLGSIDLSEWAQTIDVADSPFADDPLAAHLMQQAVAGGMGDGPRLLDRIGWVIVGGESGPGARPMHPEWARSLRDQCVAAGIPYFFKQWGEWATEDQSPPDIVLPAESIEVWPGVCVFRVGKHRAGRDLDGRQWNEFPSCSDLRHG